MSIEEVIKAVLVDHYMGRQCRKPTRQGAGDLRQLLDGHLRGPG